MTKNSFNPFKELELLLELGLTEEDTFVDFGTGTSVVPLAVAEHCNRAIAVDISETML